MFENSENKKKIELELVENRIEMVQRNGKE